MGKNIAGSCSLRDDFGLILHDDLKIHKYVENCVYLVVAEIWEALTCSESADHG